MTCRARRVCAAFWDGARQRACPVRMASRVGLTFLDRATILDRLTDPARKIFATKSVWVYAFSCCDSFVSRDETHLASAERLVSTVVWPHAGQHTILQFLCRGQELQAVMVSGSKRCPHSGQMNSDALILPIRSVSELDSAIHLSGMTMA
jgi:hypothetical protein